MDLRGGEGMIAEAGEASSCLGVEALNATQCFETNKKKKDGEIEGGKDTTKV